MESIDLSYHSLLVIQYILLSSTNNTEILRSSNSKLAVNQRIPFNLAKNKYALIELANGNMIDLYYSVAHVICLETSWSQHDVPQPSGWSTSWRGS